MFAVHSKCLFRVELGVSNANRTVRVTCESGKSHSKKKQAKPSPFAAGGERLRSSSCVWHAPHGRAAGTAPPLETGVVTHQGLKRTRPGQQMRVQLYYGASGDLI